MAVNCPDIFSIFWTIVNVLPVGIYQKQKVSLKELRQFSHHAIKVDGKSASFSVSFGVTHGHSTSKAAQ